MACSDQLGVDFPHIRRSDYGTVEKPPFAARTIHILCNLSGKSRVLKFVSY